MCGRFTLASPAEVVAEVFGLDGTPELAPRYNISPGQEVAAVRVGEGARRELAMLRWGLIPSWAKDPTIGNRMINARAETAAEKPAFRAALWVRRCLVPADGFYEWAPAGPRKQPYLIAYADGRPFGIAGLWETWRPPGGAVVESCTLLTTAPNEVVAPLHDRMPVIVPASEYGRWLDPGEHRPEAVAALLRPAPSAGMAARAVGLRVNNPANEGPGCVEPAG